MTAIFNSVISEAQLDFRPGKSLFWSAIHQDERLLPYFFRSTISVSLATSLNKVLNKRSLSQYFIFLYHRMRFPNQFLIYKYNTRPTDAFIYNITDLKLVVDSDISCWFGRNTLNWVSVYSSKLVDCQKHVSWITHCSGFRSHLSYSQNIPLYWKKSVTSANYMDFSRALKPG